MITTRGTKRGALAPLTLAVVLAAAAALPAQETPPGPSPQCEEMMAMHQGMHSRMEEMDSQLADLVARMNAASGEEKTDAIAAVVTELVTQRQAMHAMMAEMQPMMMQHMMRHMGSGMMEGMEHSMAGCPMMGKSPAEEDDEGETEHSAHHPEG
jgi:hypothetical protein